MAELIDLLDVMESKAPAKKAPTRPRPFDGSANRASPPDTTGKESDPNVVKIQNLLISHKLPVGKRKPFEADGVYGPTTHESLTRFANAFHSDAQMKSRAAAIKALLTDNWREMLPRLKEVAGVVETERAMPAKPSAEPADKPSQEREQFDITIELDGKKQRFPLMAAIRTPSHLLYTFELFGLYNRNATPQEKAQQILDANRKIREFIPEDWVGARTVFDDYSQFLSQKVSQEAQGNQVMPDLLDWLDARFNTIMPNIPQSLYPQITRYVYSLDPRMVSSPNTDAKITDLKRLRTYTATIHHQLVLMMREAPAQVRRPIPPQRQPNVLKQVYPYAQPQAPQAPSTPPGSGRSGLQHLEQGVRGL